MKKNFTYLFVIIALSFNAISQSNYCTNDNNFTNIPLYKNNYSSNLDVVYDIYTNENNKKKKLMLDLYYPNNSPFIEKPLVMLIHGGGFSSNDRKKLTDVAIQFAESGYVAATIDYRLTQHNCDQNLYNEAVYKAIQDAHKALLFLVKKKALYGINPRAIFIGGVSAGAVTAINTVYLDQDEVNDINPNLSTTYGPLRPVGAPTINIRGVFSSSGAMIENVFDNNQAIPQISFHGAQDDIVPIGSGIGICSGGVSWGSNTIHDLLDENNTCVVTYVDPLGDHGVYNGEKEIRNGLVMNFFKSIMCNDCVGTNKCITSSLSQLCNNNFVSNSKTQNTTDFKNKIYLQNETTLRIEFDRTNTNQIEFSIYDTMGKLILNQNANIENASNYVEVHIGNLLSKGVYVVKWNDKNGNYYSNKIIKN
jgi:predicted esterase